ncbi:MAG: hypothetical protein JSV98_02990 [candidate division WOR-3 bacterium]|nr:MAG: hypothetical protein JSV98_02990 [candidate division WOR-3 bacterium]
MTNSEIRRRILELLYKSYTEHPYNRITPKEFKEMLNIGLKELHFNIIYLEEKGYLELSKPLEGSVFVGARITPRGVDLVEDEYEFNVFFPEESIKIPDEIFVEFENLISETSGMPHISKESKELILEELKFIQQELQNKEPRYSKIKQKTESLKTRDSEIWQKFIKIIKRPSVARVLSSAAQKELGI